MSKGALPVPHIIAILLGIIVVALLGYWFYTTGGSFSGIASEAACRGKLLQYCTFWSGCGYQPQCQPGGAGFYDAKNSEDCKPHDKKLSSGNSDVTDTCKQLLKQASGVK